MSFARVSLITCLFFCSSVRAQEAPAPENAWLEQFTGEWETTSEFSVGPGVPQLTSSGTMSSRMLGGHWVVSEMSAEMMGTKVEAVQTLGYDAEKQKYIGTWVDSMASHLWKYEGSVDETGNKLTLEAEGPNFMAGGELTKFRDAYEFKSPDHFVATSSMLGESGEWVAFMTGDFRRKK